MSDVVEAVELRTRLSSPELRQLVERFVRRRVPESDSDDVIQTVLCEALAAARPFADEEELRRWLVGVARHKVADFHRRGTREKPSELPELEAPAPPIEEGSLARWASEQAGGPDAQRTLRWMAREGEGEKLANIAAEEKLPPAAVRQRVSRLRRMLKERWLAELAAVAIVATIAFLVWRLLQKDDPRIAPLPDVPTAPGPHPPPAPPPNPTAPAFGPLSEARRLRAAAFAACDEGRFSECLGGLDAARGLDPEGDAAPEVAAARARARSALGTASSSSATVSLMASGSASQIPPEPTASDSASGSAAPFGSGRTTPRGTSGSTSKEMNGTPGPLGTDFPPKGTSLGSGESTGLEQTPQGKLPSKPQGTSAPPPAPAPPAPPPKGGSANDTKK